MAYETLLTTLAEFEGGPVEIEEVHILKFGALLYAEAWPKEDEPYRYKAVRELKAEPWEPEEEITKTIQRALEQHPNVFHVEVVDPERPEAVYGSRTGILQDGPTFRMEVRLPKSRQQFQGIAYITEHFKVICNGSFFGAYASIEDAPVFANIGQEFRDLAQKQIKESTKYDVPSFGPTPIWPDIYIIRLKEGQKVRTDANLCFERQNNLYFLTRPDLSIDEAAGAIFQLSLSFWRQFYYLSLRGLEFSDLDSEIGNRLKAASDMVRKITGTPSWKIWKNSSFATEAALQIGELHLLLAEYDDLYWSYEKSRTDYLKGVREKLYFSKLEAAMKKYCRNEFRVPVVLAGALDFMSKQIEVSRNVRTLILASLLGAISGALMTGLLSLIKSK